MDKASKAIQELMLRKSARVSIYEYIRYMSRTGLLTFKFSPEKHHKLIIDDLHKMIDGDHYREAFSLPPGSAKSTYISIIFPTFLMAQDPTLKILCICNSETLSDDFARKRRSIMRSDEWKAISCTALAPDEQSLGAMGTLKGGSIYGAGAGSTITGLRADWIIMDDLVRGIEQASSMVQLDKIWSWLISEARSRGRPNCREVLVATRWSAIDPIGRVLELTNEGKENWKYIRIPMECDSADDPLKRKIGERLWPQWFTKQMVTDAKRDPAIWLCLYQQMPLVSTGEWCPSQHIHIVPQPPKIMKYYIGIDIALSISNKSDFTVFAVFALGVDRDLTIVEIYRNQRSVDHTAKDFVKICQKYEPAGVYIDDDNASKVWAKLVFEVSKQEGVPLPMQILPISRRDKETRAAPLRSYFLQDRISILQAPWNTDLLFEISKFPVGCRHDDQIDAMALVAAQLMKLSAPKVAEKKAIEHQTAIGIKDGKMVLNESLDLLWQQRDNNNSRFSKIRI